mmetsp:Transcript_3349/g.8932  ORF Transcript_3349/g.8932 Transcript_3349/m.8932 type:complete len:254 (-) Transcript_3349:284-1045(-)
MFLLQPQSALEWIFLLLFLLLFDVVASHRIILFVFRGGVGGGSHRDGRRSTVVHVRIIFVDGIWVGNDGRRMIRFFSATSIDFAVVLFVVLVVVVNIFHVLLLFLVVVIVELLQETLGLLQPQESLYVFVPDGLSHIGQVLLDLRLGSQGPEFPSVFMKGQATGHVHHPVRVGGNETARVLGHGLGGFGILGLFIAIVEPGGDAVANYRQSLWLDKIIGSDGLLDPSPGLFLELLFLLSVLVGDVLIGGSSLL